MRNCSPDEVPSETSTDAEPAAASEVRRLRVLLVDDEPAILRLVVTILKSQEFEVVTADDAFGAISRFQGGTVRFDVVLLDFLLPNLSGQEAIRRLRQLQADIHIVLMSGFGVAEIDPGSIEQADDFLSKPFTPSQLVQAVRRASPSRQLSSKE